MVQVNHTKNWSHGAHYIINIYNANIYVCDRIYIAHR